jgi:DivIVA domain-containing protein
MSLTAEDIVNKQFKPKPRLSEGYDADDVDDVLDEVVKEFRALRAEAEDLRQKLTGANGRIAELQRSGGSASSPTAVAAAAGGDANDSATSSQLLQLARKLHDQHVQEGRDERQRIIDEGKTSAQRLIAEAEMKQREEINELDQQRIAVERKIEELKQFEKEYRSHLKQYLETQLVDLNASGQDSAKSF